MPFLRLSRASSIVSPKSDTPSSAHSATKTLFPSNISS